MSLCDSCPKPGACCNGFTLSLHPRLQFKEKSLEVLVELARYFLPFVPTYWDETMHCWRFRCLVLGLDGRCTEYSTRPEFPCKVYRPACDPLCVLHVPLEDQPSDRCDFMPPTPMLKISLVEARGSALVGLTPGISGVHRRTD